LGSARCNRSEPACRATSARLVPDAEPAATSGAEQLIPGLAGRTGSWWQPRPSRCSWAYASSTARSASPGPGWPGCRWWSGCISFALAVVLGRRFFYWLGGVITACGVVGLVLAVTGAGAAAIALASGVLPGAVLLGFAWWGAHRTARAAGHIESGSASLASSGVPSRWDR